ncbi:MAG: type II toxin-antitoxin system RelE/ParE family toxin [bacterium]|nr:type II toxin-antitoxin system RelE/ParE family toxin [bacterium]
MALRFTVVYQLAVTQEDIPRITEPWREKIKSAIEDKLTRHPDVYGKPLRRSLRGYRKLRVGDYRVVFRIEIALVKIFAIAHRSVVYKIMERRVL